MATRASELPEEQFGNEVKSLRQDLDEIKNQQIVGGDNLLTYFVEGSTITKTGITDFDEAGTWRIIFTSDSGVASYAQFEVEGVVTGDVDGVDIWQWEADPAYVGSNQIAWILRFFNYAIDPVDVTFRVGFRTVEGGTVTWEEI